uniref:Uncharacterized protein n=1 Tax=Arundo donax TaxID=35708 RepID=A0A0A8ZRN2_ARUDO
MLQHPFTHKLVKFHAISVMLTQNHDLYIYILRFMIFNVR